jgi:hypothetical protein
MGKYVSTRYGSTKCESAKVREAESARVSLGTGRKRIARGVGRAASVIASPYPDRQAAGDRAGTHPRPPVRDRKIEGGSSGRGGETPLHPLPAPQGGPQDEGYPDQRGSTPRPPPRPRFFVRSKEGRVRLRVESIRVLVPKRTRSPPRGRGPEREVPHPEPDGSPTRAPIVGEAARPAGRKKDTGTAPGRSTLGSLIEETSP